MNYGLNLILPAKMIKANYGVLIFNALTKMANVEMIERQLWYATFVSS